MERNEIIMETKIMSINYLQQTFCMGFNRTRKIIDELRKRPEIEEIYINRHNK